MWHANVVTEIMKTLSKTTLTFLTVGLLTCAVQANTITPSVQVVNSPGAWSYNADLTSGQLVAGDGFTIFDFGGYVPGSIVAPVNWTATAQLLGNNVAGGTDITGDNPFEFNLLFTYTGPTITQTIGATTFTGFGATTVNRSTTLDGWVSRDHEPNGNVGTVHTDVILVPNSVPDGGSAVALLGIALAGIEGARRLVRSRKA